MGQFHMEFSKGGVKKNCRGVYCVYKLNFFQIKPVCCCSYVVVSLSVFT